MFIFFLFVFLSHFPAFVFPVQTFLSFSFIFFGLRVPLSLRARLSRLFISVPLLQLHTKTPLPKNFPVRVFAVKAFLQFSIIFVRSGHRYHSSSFSVPFPQRHTKTQLAKSFSGFLFSSPPSQTLRIL